MIAGEVPKERLLELLTEGVRKAGSRQQWASAHHVPVRAVGMALDRTRGITPSIANALGYVVAEVYLPIGQAARSPCSGSST